MPDILSALNPVLRAALTLLSRSRAPQVEGSLPLPGLGSPAEVLRDRWGVPHIYASNRHDLMRAQGFVHAQDRLWQMEFNRRLVAGRLSEVMGAATATVDRWMRTLTLRRVAESEVPLLDAETRGALDAYTAGVNAFIERGRLPVEFALLRCRPEPWIAADTLAWIKMMSLMLSVNWQAEIRRAQLAARLGPERAAELGRALPRRLADRRPARGGPVAHRRSGGRTGAGSRAVHRPAGSRGPGQQQLGHRRSAHGDRQAAAGERHAPEPDRPCHLVREPPVRGRRARRRRHVPRHPRNRGRPQRTRGVGIHQRLSRRAGFVCRAAAADGRRPRAGRAQRRVARRDGVARDDPRQRRPAHRRGSDRHPARTDHQRPRAGCGRRGAARVALDIARARHDGRRPVPDDGGARLRRVPRGAAPLGGPGAERRLRRRRRQHRLQLPGQSPHPRQRRRPHAGARLDRRVRMDRHTSPTTSCRTS